MSPGGARLGPNGEHHEGAVRRLHHRGVMVEHWQDLGLGQFVGARRCISDSAHDVGLGCPVIEGGTLLPGNWNCMPIALPLEE